ncbi:MAG: peptidoglycan-binding protein [Phycisphaerae bacterium]|nr:peptidoglycan-binding protein [Phycisphaerae bacterium]
MALHTIQQGEHITRIALDHGFTDPAVIWDHAQNKALKDLRKNPNVLAPGDKLFIPDKSLRTEERPTENSHKFRLHTRGLRLVVTIHKPDHSPLKDTPIVLEVEGTRRELKTDTHGRINEYVPAHAESARLKYKEDPALPETVVDLKIGHLDPADTPAGQRARLHNLGYDTGDPDNPADLKTAVEEFQLEFGLKVDGIIGPKTINALIKAHGC